MQVHTITPYLWFDNNAQEAAKFYCSIFKDSKLITDSPMMVEFELNGQKFLGLNGGPLYKFSEAISFLISVETQEEVDYYWNALTANGGQESECAWLKDKYGLSWQVVPTKLMTLMSDPDPLKAKRVMDAMLKMKKIIIADLEAAYAG